jgi:hypothetical protein
MGMCPYCGESISDTAVQCTRCGMMLEEGAEPPEEAAPPPAAAKAGAPAKGAGGAAKGGAAAARPASAAKPPSAAKKVEPCPKCDKPVPVKAHRCPSCGTMLREIVSDSTRAEEAKFQRTVYLGVGAAALALLVAVLAIGFFGGAKQPKNREWAKVKFDELAAFCGPSAKGSDERQRSNWLKFGGKWVRWEGRVVEIEKGGLMSDGALLVRHRDGPGSDPDVRVALPAEEIAKPGVAVGAKVHYTGRLLRYDGSNPAFHLDFGEVLSAKE